MNGYSKGVGSWDDDDTKPQPIEPYSDNWIMQYGNEHMGKMLMQVPGKYLLWMYENFKPLDLRLKAYIELNLDSINNKHSS